MRGIKETITALTAGNEPGAVHYNRKEHVPMSDLRFELILKCVTRVAIITAITVLAINVDIKKMVALLIFGILFGLIYFGLKD